MKHTVDWLPAAEHDLTEIWNDAPDQAHVTAAADAIDADLARDPLGVGESREGTSRIYIVPPLAVEYDVIADDAKVTVWNVWRWGLSMP